MRLGHQRWCMLDEATDHMMNILHGHYTHTRNIDVIELARENNIEIHKPQPSTSGLSRSSLNLVSPYDISPVPNKKRITSKRGRKCSVASIITSSPYKNDLIDQRNKKTQKENKITKAKNKKQNKNKLKRKPLNEKTDSSDDDEMILFDTDSEPEGLEKRTAPDTEDAECMFCHMLFSNDTQGETWIKCLMCGLWAHNDCAGAEFDTWICDFCK
ncbi:hypothetical protein ACJJTC_005805 [Scirpophaga incertulas]